MARVFITGAQGFTGRYLVPYLSNRGYEVHGLVRAGENVAASALQAHVGDLAVPDSLASALDAARPDAIVHLAGIAFVAHGEPREIYDANLIGSRNLLQAIVDVGIKPSSVLLASSANIYGNQLGGVLDENTVPRPANEYGISKLAMEMVARLFMDALPITIVRPFNYTGVGQSVDFVIPKIVDHVRRGADKIQLGNIDVERDFSDVRGVSAIYARLIEEQRAVGETYNVCSGRGYSLRSIIGMVEAISGRQMRVEVNPAFVRRNEVQQLYGDNSKLQNLLGDVQMPPLEDTLRWMIEA